MIKCISLDTNTGCGAENRLGALYCCRCGTSLTSMRSIRAPDRMVNKYQIIELVGSSASGAVYKAIDTSKSAFDATRIVALKETKKHVSHHISAHTFNTLKNSSHINLPHYYAMFEEHNSRYIVMEFVPGKTLGEYFDNQQGFLPESLILTYAIQICDVLHYLHSLKPCIIHRDIKPTNIRVTSLGIIKLVGLDLLTPQAATPDQPTSPDRSFNYAPLEQLPGYGGPTIRSDIYSLGATLYYLLTKELPTSAFRRHMGGALIRPRSLNVRLSLSTTRILEKALAMHDQERFASAKVFQQALIEAITPSSSRGGTERMCPSCKKGNRLTALFCGHCREQLPRKGTITVQMPIITQEELHKHRASTELLSKSQVSLRSASMTRLPKPRIMLADGTALLVPAGKTECFIGRHDHFTNNYPDIDLGNYGGETYGVSRNHAQLVQIGTQWTLSDLNSSNHTFVDGTKLLPFTPTPVQNGARIHFGRLETTFYW